MILFWLVAVLIFTSSYTASLSSIIIVQQQQQQTPIIRSFRDLQNSRLHIGCQEGSFTLDYLKNHYQISSDRLIEFNTDKDYVDALNSNEVAAIIDESPYIETFLTSLGCDYTVVESNIVYFGGFSFVSIVYLIVACHLVLFFNACHNNDTSNTYNTCETRTQLENLIYLTHMSLFNHVDRVKSLNIYVGLSPEIK